LKAIVQKKVSEARSEYLSFKKIISMLHSFFKQRNVLHL